MVSLIVIVLYRSKSCHISGGGGGGGGGQRREKMF